MVVPLRGGSGRLAQVGQGVVHPAHVPFESEAQSAQVSVGRVTPGQEVDSSAIVMAPGYPLVGGGVRSPAGRRPPRGSPARRTGWAAHSPSLPRVVQVEHRGDGVDPQAVHVELRRSQYRSRWRRGSCGPRLPAEVEDVGAPVHLLAAARIGVLVESRPVEAGEGEGVLGEVGRHPVDACTPMPAWCSCVDQVTGSRPGLPKRERRCVVGRHLITPRRRRRGARRRAGTPRG